MTLRFTFFRARGVVNLLVVIALLSAMAVAQSGRRLPKGSPPVATPTTTPEPTAETKPPPKPEITLKVVSDISQGGAQTFLMPTRLHSWVVERLRRSLLLDVRDGGSTGRSKAIKQAKAETEAYVVLLELQSDPFGSMRRSSARESTVVLTVYHPVSAKVKFSRMMSVGQIANGLPGTSTVVQACNPGVYGNDLLLLEASIAAANSVMNSFSVPLPPLCRRTGL